MNITRRNLVLITLKGTKVKQWLGNKIALNVVQITRVNAETNLKDLSILFWQLLEKRNLLLFCSCSKVMFHYLC